MPYYDDNGNELDPAAGAIPKMCLMCGKKDLPEEEILCNLNRLDQAGKPLFKCGVYLSLYGALIDDIIE